MGRQHPSLSGHYCHRRFGSGELDDQQGHHYVRTYQDVPSQGAHSGAVGGCEKGVVQNNIFALDRTDGQTVWDYGVDSLAYFNNQKPSGERLLGWDYDGQRPRDELSTRIEDSTLMAL